MTRMRTGTVSCVKRVLSSNLTCATNGSVDIGMELLNSQSGFENSQNQSSVFPSKPFPVLSLVTGTPWLEAAFL